MLSWCPTGEKCVILLEAFTENIPKAMWHLMGHYNPQPMTQDHEICLLRADSSSLRDLYIAVEYITGHTDFLFPLTCRFILQNSKCTRSSSALSSTCLDEAKSLLSFTTYTAYPFLTGAKIYIFLTFALN